jgi:hypothetical protein
MKKGKELSSYDKKELSKAEKKLSEATCPQVIAILKELIFIIKNKLLINE